MKRYSPLAFLLLLVAAFIGKPLPSSWRPTMKAFPPLADPVEVVDPPPPPEAEAPASPEADSAPPPADEPRTVGTYAKPKLWLALHQNHDGSWGDGPANLGGRTIGRTGITALALLSFVGDGYTQLSRDEFEGLEGNVGRVVRKALEWMIKDQRPDGSFGSVQDAAFDQALAALALSEAYGRTASQHLKGYAENAVIAMLLHQQPDGSWGGPEETAWAIQAMDSARLSELPTSSFAQALALRYVEATPHVANLWSRLALTRKRQAAADDPAVAAPPIPAGDGGDFHDWYLGALGAHRYDGPPGPLWTQWNEPMKDVVARLRQEDGSWGGGTRSHAVVRSSLAQLALQIHHTSHSNVFVGSR
ncbi:MAG: hypothetical protein HY293_15500 [Planctomycetes bacterium]|nr:hypothetical protein [Planctomycetota bacterium]